MNLKLKQYSKEDAKKEIKKLIDNYNSNKIHYKESSEMDIRMKLIDNLFEILGWDVWGKKDINEVKREETIADKESKKKKADYTFRINGIPKLVVEAKKIKGIDLKNDDFIDQAVGYSYNLACPWAILTNFHGLVIYYVDKSDRYSFYEIRDISDESKFEDIFDILWYLSKESMKNGLLEKEAERRGIRPQKEKVGKQLYEDLKEWRRILSNEVKKKYPDYTRYDIEEIVQKIIDRLIFIRKVEDMGIEERHLEQLTRRFDSDEKVYENLRILFRTYRTKYNSGVFGDKTEHECDRIIIDRNVIKKVVEGMYKPKGREIEYNFSVIDSDILGNIYEQYLAFILKDTPKKAKLEGGRSHRKEQGIYYTPSYIVDYIVKNTVRESLKDKNIDQILSTKILDPACGSGSFLTKAFSEVCDIVEDKLASGFRSEKSLVLKDYNNRLTLQQKVTILLSCIYGVDLDRKAVEIAQLNLLFKLLEGETAESMSKLGEVKKLLPTLSSNIKSGNSLIDNPEVAGDDAFVWEEEFEDIIKGGGFDVIIGNPPYGAELSIKEKEFLTKKYDIGSTDTAILFIKKSFDLLKYKEKLGFIVPKAFCFVSTWKKIRDLVWNDVETIIDCGKVWKEVKLEQIIFILNKNNKLNKYNSGNIENNEIRILGKISKEDAKDFGFFLNGVSEEEVKLAEKIKNNSIMLNDISINQRGAILQRFLSEEGELEVIGGAQIKKFGIGGLKGKINKIKIDSDQAYIRDNSILVQRIVAHITKPIDHIQIICAIPDKSNNIIVDTINQITIKEGFSQEFVWALLNSKLINWYVYRFIFGRAIRTMQFDNPTTSRIPIPNISENKQKDIFDLSRDIIELYKKLDSTLKNSDKYEKVNIKLERLNNQMNHIIYDFYGLTKDEIKIIEDSFK